MNQSLSFQGRRPVNSRRLGTTIRRASRPTCNNSTRVWRTIFPPQDQSAVIQTCELNRRRTEARCLIPFETTAATVVFPFVAQAARLTRCVDSPKHPAQGVEREFLLSSRPSAALPAAAMLQADRRHWGIETGLHLRWDVILGEDRSRVRHRTSALAPAPCPAKWNSPRIFMRRWRTSVPIRNDSLARHSHAAVVGFSLLPITPAHCATLLTLPFHHRDPFDRLLLAQAKTEGMTLVTNDGQFGSYGVPWLW